MSNHILFLVFFLALSFESADGQTITFEMPFYFEDAVGNRDTIIVGYGPDFHPDSTYTSLGETALPCNYFMDKDLHVLVNNKPYFDCDNKLSKIKYSHFSGACKNEPSIPLSSSFHIKCKYPPLRISWDNELICNGASTPCTAQSIIFSTYMYHLIEDIHIFQENDIARSLCNSNELIEPLGGFYRPDGWPYSIYREQVNPDNSIDSIYIIEVIFSNYLNFLLMDAEVIPSPSNTLTLYPQPVQDQWYMERKDASSSCELYLYDVHGKLIWQNRLESGEISGTWSLRHLPAGSYVLVARDADLRLQTYKIIKQ